MKKWKKLEMRIMAAFLCLVLVLSTPAFGVAAELASSSDASYPTVEMHGDMDTLVATRSNPESPKSSSEFEIQIATGSNPSSPSTSEDSKICEECGEAAHHAKEECPVYEAAHFYEILMGFGSLRDMFDFINEHTDEALAMDESQVRALEKRVKRIYNGYDDVPEDEEDVYVELIDIVALLLEGFGICYHCNMQGGLHASFCVNYTPWTATPFTIEPSTFNGRTGSNGEVRFSKELLKDANGNLAIQIEAWTEGSTTVVPTDIVVALDHSASVYTAVDKSQVWTWEQFSQMAEENPEMKEKASQFQGYYVVINKFYGDIAEDLNENTINPGDYCYALVRWNQTANNGKGQWERCYLIKISEGEYTNRRIDTSFGHDNRIIRSQDQLATSIEWYPITENDGRKFNGSEAKYFQSIYGATVDALTAFIDEVKNIPECRIAFTGFAGHATPGTGLFVNQVLQRRIKNINNHDEYYLNDEDLKASLFDASRTDLLENIVKNYIPIYGGTSTEEGIYLANRIFEVNPDTDDRKPNRSLLLFTDGVPNQQCEKDYDYPSTSEANRSYSAAVFAAYKTKNKYGVTVYSVGPATAIAAANDKQKDFMDYISSNYPNAQTLEDHGTKVGDDCHIIADDAAGLEAAFQSLGEKIFNASMALNAGAEIRDTVTEYFNIGGEYDDGKIKVWSIPYVKDSVSGTVGFDEEQKELLYNGQILYDKDGKKLVDVQVETGTKYEQEIPDNETPQERIGSRVIVTGFDYQANTVYPDEGGGKKLRILIPIEPDPKFIGGNDVPTNSEDSGIFGADGENFGEFEPPKTDIEITKIEIMAPDIYSYIGSSTFERLTLDKIQRPITLWRDEDNPILLKTNEPNFGLSNWQVDYVDISVTMLDAVKQTVADGIADIQNDTTYSLEIEIDPKEEGTAKLAAQSEEAGIFVFYPELVFEDQTYWYGEPVPSSSELQTGNVEIKWRLKDEKDGNVVYTTAPVFQQTNLIIDTMPDVTFTCTPNASGTLPKHDVEVDVTVSQIGYVKAEEGTNLNQNVAFRHVACNPECGYQFAPQGVVPKEDVPEFYLHINSCNLTITKSGGETGEPYVFRIKRNGTDYTEATIVGNDSVTIWQLPVGEYTVEEDLDWSWRYDKAPKYEWTLGDGELSRNAPAGSITCTNTKTNNQWFNDFTEVIANIFSISKTTSGSDSDSQP